MTITQIQLLNQAQIALYQLNLLITMAKTADSDALKYHSITDFVALLEKPFDELSACLCDEVLDV